MNLKTLISIALVIFVTGCGSTRYLEKISPFKKDETTLEPKKGAQSVQKNNEIFVCAGDIDVTYKKLGEVSLGEFGFSGHDILAYKIKEKASAVGAQAVINVQYDTGASKSWQGYGELGGTDYGIKHTSWCKGIAIVLLESHDPLGLMLCSLTRENKEWFGFKKSQTGVIVVNIEPGSIAANAGIEVEDLITEWNGEKVESKSQLEQMIGTNTGKEARLSVLRTGEIKMMSLSVPVRERSRIASSAPKSPTRENKPSSEKKASSQNKLSSDSADVHNEVGDLYLRKGMYDEAMEEYKKAIEADPGCAIAHFNLSIVYDKKGMKEEADEEYITYKKLKPKRVNPP
ncbi:MAG TPA: tetratricopeptide repeat protein [Candidatus Wunengus sp. YC60]|uniref:tetratricopeptide repeat protein n=1 Tax=Candidatus Wunengus sp. YC60 TaxID=3367697 RepID=UPI004028D8A0